MKSDVELHRQEQEENLARWSGKPLLNEVYLDLHRQMAAHLVNVPGEIVELGSGVADIRDVIPRCIRTGLFPFPGIDRIANAYRLPFEDQSLSNVLMLDVFHHLRYPGTALLEIRRVLAPGGRLILMEPGLGLLGRFVYGLLHPEPLGSARQITWMAPPGWSPDDLDYYAAQGNATRIFTRNPYADRLADWTVLLTQRLAALSYVASGGYTGPQLYPTSAHRFMMRLDGALSRLPALFATRLLVVLAKSSSPPGTEVDFEKKGAAGANRIGQWIVRAPSLRTR